jgi:hypothetical protein
MEIKIGQFSISDIKSFFITNFNVGEQIETIIENGSESLRLQYKILSLERDGALLRLLEEEWKFTKRSKKFTYYEREYKIFIHQDKFKHFKKYGTRI